MIVIIMVIIAVFTLSLLLVGKCVLIFCVSCSLRLHLVELIEFLAITSDLIEELFNLSCVRVLLDLQLHSEFIYSLL